jgi:uncharacterized membrane protein
MENKNVGMLIIGIAVVMVIIVLIFSSAVGNILGDACSHGNECTMYQGLRVQTLLSLSIVAIIFVIGFIIMCSKPKEKIVIKKVKEPKKKLDLSNLDKDERKVVDLLIEEGKAMFQADLMEKLEIGKVKTTRLLDKLEAKQLVERKRRGMNNIVVLKD